MAEQGETAERTDVEEAPPRPFVRVVSEDGLGMHARVELVDGDETTQVPFVRSATVSLKAGAPNVAELEVLLVDSNVSAELVRLREIAVPPEPKPHVEVVIGPPRRRWYGLRRSDFRVLRWTPAGAGAIADVVLAGTTRPRAPVAYLLEDRA